MLQADAFQPVRKPRYLRQSKKTFLVMRILIVSFLLVSVLPCFDGFTECIKPKPTPIDETFLTTNKFYYAMHSDCDNCEKEDKRYSPMKGRTASTNVCFDVTGIVKDGEEFSYQMGCHYNKPESMLCKASTPAGTVPDGGSVTITKTDNKTYFAASTCVFGRENAWLVAAITPEIDDKLKQEIIKDFVDKKFKPDNVAVEGKSAIIFKTLAVTKDKEC